MRIFIHQANMVDSKQ